MVENEINSHTEFLCRFVVIWTLEVTSGCTDKICRFRSGLCNRRFSFTFHSKPNRYTSCSLPAQTFPSQTSRWFKRDSQQTTPCPRALRSAELHTPVNTATICGPSQHGKSRMRSCDCVRTRQDRSYPCAVAIMAEEPGSVEVSHGTHTVHLVTYWGLHLLDWTGLSAGPRSWQCMARFANPRFRGSIATFSTLLAECDNES
jgi:hypothetical protein